MTTDTEYANTDFDLKSNSPFDTMCRELSQTCRVIYYTAGEDGRWHSIVEAEHGECSSKRNAALDILAIVDAITTLSPIAKAELAACDLREFNIGIECWDTWAYVHTLPANAVRAVADLDCSIAVTLYPMRHPDGSPKVSVDHIAGSPD